MAQQQNHYLADLREIQFVLFEQCGLGDLLKEAPFAGAFDESGVDMVLDEAYQFATTVVGPINSSGDEEGCHIVDGQVKTPAGFAEAWKRVYDSGLRLVSIESRWGGSGAPTLLGVAVEELVSGANTAFGMYPGLAIGAAEVITKFGTEGQKTQYLPRLYGGKWGGTMCLSEPQAGSDVGAARTRAVKQPDGRFLISGTKIFISGGDHDLAENIIHLVLARTENAPAGTKGLSLFIVPKFRINSDGSAGEPNDVSLGGIEHKMGIRASSTAVLNFGENGACLGEMVGGPASEHQGMKQMFAMMNFARIGVGIQSLAVASTAYLNALRYSRERKQGSSIERFKDPTAPRVPIIEHADVRRMLLDMKARVEGLRALIAKVSMHHDRAMVAQHANDSEKATYHLGQVELLTPLVKAYGSDQSFRICETAIQTLGGVGYTCDYGIEQYCRDAKIFSIYEGTNHIQAMDLIGRKLGMAGGANLQTYLSEIQRFVSTHSDDPALGKEAQLLGEATSALQGATMRLLSWFHGGQLELVPLFANRFLEMMAENTIGWLLLEQAVIANAKLATLDKEHPDWAFYVGKRHAALYFARNVMPGVADKADILAREDKSPVEIPDAAFSRV